MKDIPLRNGGTFRVSDADYPFLSQFRDWKKRKDQDGSYHVERVVIVGKRRLNIRAHRLITEARPDQKVSALDGDLMNCTRANLHIQTLSPWTGRPSGAGYRGVKQINASKWRVEIEVGGELIVLTETCNDPKIGARMYDAAARKIYGIHAQTNF